MRVWDRAKALAAFEAFNLTGTNAALAVYWLSLWKGDAPPRRADFNPLHVKDLLPAIALTEMRAGDAAVCRVSGRYIELALGGPMRGVNMLALVGGAQREIRKSRLNAIVDGGVGLSRTRFETAMHEGNIAETLQLPFHGETEDGARLYLTHTDWRPHPSDLLTPPPPVRWSGVPDTYIGAALV